MNKPEPARIILDKRQKGTHPFATPRPAIPTTPPNASINRVQIVDLPGLPMDDDVRGAQAYHLLSAPTVVRYAQAHAAALDLPPAYRAADPDAPDIRREAPPYVDAALSSPDPDVRAAAERIARRLGRNLGYILLTLHRGDAINRAARAEWADAEWAQWGEVQRVWIGGGLMRSDLGARIIEHARELLAETGYGEALGVARTSQPHPMALIGAARYLPMTEGVALCCDFGQTGAKRALIEVHAGAITRIHHLATRPVEWPWRNDPQAARQIDAAEVRDFVATTIAQTLAEHRARDLAPEVMCSVAAYVRGGTLLGNGIYATLMRLTGGDDARPLLEAAVREQGETARVHLIHDGTAAAALHAGTPRAAVLVIGTAIGVGFPPPTTEGLLDLRM